MKPWYSIQAKSDDVAELDIYDVVGDWGVNANDFSKALKAVTAGTIQVNLNTPGGDVFAGLGIHNMLRDSGKKINVRVTGIAASIGSIIAMAGDVITMPENAMMMVHNPWTFALGNASELRETADVLDKIGASLTTIYVKRTGKTEEEIKALLATDTWLSAQECVDQGFADEIADSVVARAKYDVSDLPEHVQALFAAARPKAQEPAKGQQGVDEGAKGPIEDEDDDELDRLQNLAANAGLPEDVIEILALRQFDTPRAQAQGVRDASQIVRLCALVKSELPAKEFIAAGKSVKETRALLLAARTQMDVEADTSSTKKAQPKPAASTKPQLTIDSIYQQQNQNRKGY